MPLNTAGDGAYAYTDQDTVAQYSAVEWLIEYVEDNNNNNGGGWSDWASAEAIVENYQPAIAGDGKIHSLGDGLDEPLEAIVVEARGLEILTACIAGDDPQALLGKWRDDIFDATYGDDAKLAM